jgi:hypothetical protein
MIGCLMNNEFGKDAEGRRSGVIKCTIPAFAWRD